MNPWLEIPLEDYEAHMNMDSVQQSELISNVLLEALKENRPQSLCYVGCAGGIGLNNVDRKVEICGIDINPLYVEEANNRYGSEFEKSEFIVHDINRKIPYSRKFDLVYVALLLEYVDEDLALENMSELVGYDGVIVFLLQKRSEQVSTISKTPYKILNRLERVFRYIDQEELSGRMESLDFAETFRKEIILKSNKGFSILHYKKNRSNKSMDLTE